MKSTVERIGEIILKVLLKLNVFLGFLAAIVFVIVAIITSAQGYYVWWHSLLGALLCLLDGAVSSYVQSLIHRLEYVESELQSLKFNKNGMKGTYILEEDKKVFSSGEPIKLRNNNEPGLIKKVLPNNQYEIELDGELGKTHIVSGDELKSWFNR
jgi:hypothetical protein